ncbi:prohibitin family protein [Thiohalocapsa sp. ML1]|uniref:prohibitin family protein n=1 Tax=Thiohalocapsa sp. ML1 TaxID=1431688 RepID=UPI000731FBBC|nr:prohibitin family protein [Thiohalocapsa sp. ML1]
MSRTDAQAEPAARADERSPLGRWLGRRLPVLLVTVLLLVLVSALLWRRIFISIEPGETGVLYRFFTGTVTQRVYPEGLHIIPPWDTMVPYETRRQVVMHELDVLSVRGLPVHLELAIRYQPQVEQLGLLHQRVGPDYADRVVVPQAESVLRRELSRFSAEQIYTNENGLLGAAVLLARDEVGRNFVEADDIVIRSISLPERVTAAIEDKLQQRQLLASYDFRLDTAHREAERKRTEATGIRDFQATVDASLTPRLLRHEGIRAARDLATSDNARVVIIGSDEGGLPLVPGGR